MGVERADRRSRPGLASLLRKNSLAIVAFTLFTSIADGVIKVGVPLTGARLTHSPLAVSALSVTTTLPFLLFSLHTGVLVDRFDRRRLVWAAGVARLVALIALFVAAVSGMMNLPVLYCAGLLLGTADVIALTAVSALVPSAVSKRHWEVINSWVMGIETVCSQFLGPVVGGLVLAVGPSFFFGFTATTVAVAALALVLLSGTFRPTRTGGGPAVPAHREIAEGVVFVWRQQTLRLLLIATAVMCACWGAWYALMPLIATGLGLSSQEYGLLIGAMGIGGVLGAASVATLNRLIGRRWVMFVDLVGTVGIVAAPLVARGVLPLMAVVFLGGLGSALWSINGRTVSQHLVPDQLRGRYSATARLVGWGPIPLGSALAGLLGEVLGLERALAVFAIPVVILAVPFMRAMHRVRLHDEAPEPVAVVTRPTVGGQGPAAGEPGVVVGSEVSGTGGAVG